LGITEARNELINSVRNKLDPEHAKINQSRIDQVRKSFQPPTDPFGLPHPGFHADNLRRNATNDMTKLDKGFKVFLDEFVRMAFEVDFPVPVNRCLRNKPLTARSFKDYLTRIKDGFAACLVSGGHPEFVLMHREELAEDAFREKVDELKIEMREYFPYKEIDDIKKLASEEFKKQLARGDLEEDTRQRWFERFKQFMNGYVAEKEKDFLQQQQHGDRAVAAAVVGSVAVTVTPLNALLFSHWSTTILFAGMGVVVGYFRHANDNYRNPEKPATMHSFGKVSFERTADMIRSGKRMWKKGMELLNLFSVPPRARE